jgi:hypothetical protein
MALTFSGTTQRLAKGSAILTAYPCSLACWVNVSNLANSSRGAMGVCNTAGSSGCMMYSDTTGHLNADNTGSNVATTTATIGTGAWHHWAAVFASSTSRTIYLDGGNSVNVQNPQNISGLNNTLIGSIYEGAYFDMAGTIAWPGIWNIDLTAAEVSALASGFSPKRIRPASLVSYCWLLGTSPEPDLKGGTYALTGSPTSAANYRILGP